MVRANLRIVWFILSSNAHAFEARDPDDGPGRPSDRVISSLLDVHASEARNFVSPGQPLVRGIIFLSREGEVRDASSLGCLELNGNRAEPVEPTAEP